MTTAIKVSEAIAAEAAGFKERLAQLTNSKAGESMSRVKAIQVFFELDAAKTLSECKSFADEERGLKINQNPSFIELGDLALKALGATLAEKAA